MGFDADEFEISCYSRKDRNGLIERIDNHDEPQRNINTASKFRSNPHFAEGLNVHAGRVTYPAVAEELGYEVLTIEEALKA